MIKTIMFLLALTAPLLCWQASPPALAQNLTNNEQEIWNLEKAYWEYVKANDLEKYRALWHEDFVGWPSFSPSPVRKDHITDWMTANISKGVTLQSYSIEQLAIRVTGDVAVTHYRIKMNWFNAEGAKAETETSRITHTWIRTRDSFQILGGMSAPVNSEGK